MFKVISAFSVAGFLINTVMALYLAVCGSFAASIGFGLIASGFFIAMVLFGYWGLNNEL